MNDANRLIYTILNDPADLAAVKTRVNSTTIGTPVASTSGTSVDFTSIPSGTKRITVSFKGVSTNGTSAVLIQIGDAGGVEATDYTGSASELVSASPAALSTGFAIGTGAAATDTLSGAMTLTLESSSTNTWSATGMFGRGDGGQIFFCAGWKSLSATLDRVRITTISGTPTFDAGEINILYE